MAIKKTFTFTIIIILILLTLFSLFSRYFQKRVKEIREQREVYHQLKLTLTSLDKDFWRLRNSFLETYEYNYKIHNMLIKNLRKLESIVFVSPYIDPEKVSKIESLSHFLNQYKFGAEKLKEKILKFEFSKTKTDADFFSYINFIKNTDKNLSSYLLLLTKLYDQYKTGRRREQFYVLMEALGALKTKNPIVKNLNNRLIDSIVYNYSLTHEIKNAKYQIKYSIYRYSSTFSHIEKDIMQISNKMGKKLNILREKLSNLYFITIFLSFLFFSIYLSWLLLRKIVKTIDRVKNVVEEIYKGNMDIRFVPQGNDEINELGKALNSMLDKIEEMNQKLKAEKEKVDKSDRLKGEFIRRISHEFRTPLNSVMGFSEVLYSMPPEDEKTRKRYIEIILQESEKLRELIEEITLFTNLEYEGYVHLESKFDLIQKIRETIDVKRKHAEEKGLELYLEDKTEKDNIVIGDVDIFQKIFMHLIDNGIKFTEKGGIRIEISDKKEEGNYVIYTFRIQDTGKGMTKEEIKNVFNPFYQSEPILTRRYGGIGLGLTIVKKLIEEMGGDIQIESIPGKGTTYILTLKFKKSR